MSNNKPSPRLQSALAPLMEQFVREKQACGYRYRSANAMLLRFDRFLSGETLSPHELPWPITRKWLAKQPHESAATQQSRISIVRQFAKYMCQLGYPAYVPTGVLGAKQCPSFCPRILTHAEVQQLLRAADQITPTALSPLRHLVLPEIFRLLYGCGLRLGEALHLRVADVDLGRGILTIREAKFGKDRLVPPALPLVLRLQKYAAGLGPRRSDAFFFPSEHGGAWAIQTIYHQFRRLLLQCGISHGGRGKGPRVHDLRHTFAVHTLLHWYQAGADIDAKLPVLAACLGHQSIDGTQRYLHLTAELFPEITVRANAAFGDVIPQGEIHHETD